MRFHESGAVGCMHDKHNCWEISIRRAILGSAVAEGVFGRCRERDKTTWHWRCSFATHYTRVCDTKQHLQMSSTVRQRHSVHTAHVQAYLQQPTRASRPRSSPRTAGKRASPTLSQCQKFAAHHRRYWKRQQQSPVQPRRRYTGSCATQAELQSTSECREQNGIVEAILSGVNASSVMKTNWCNRPLIALVQTLTAIARLRADSASANSEPEEPQTSSQIFNQLLRHDHLQPIEVQDTIVASNTECRNYLTIPDFVNSMQFDT